MRHVFVSFSGITRLTALATISALDLDPEDVLVILGRDETSIPGFECHEMQPVPMRLGRNILRFRYQLRLFDAWMRELAGDDRLSVYLPGLFSEHLYSMATNPAVDSVNLVEEGLGSLMRQTRVYSRRAGGHSRMAGIAAGRRFPAHLADCSHLLDRAFHLTPEAFPDWPKESRVQLQWPAVEVPPRYKDIHTVVSVETLVENGHASLPMYAQTLTRVVDVLKSQGTGQIGVKFHPGVTSTNERRLRVAMARIPELVFLPRGCTLEALMRPGGPVFVGAATSSLHYAAMAHCEAWTYARLIDSPGLEARLARTLDAFPANSRSRIRYIPV